MAAMRAMTAAAVEARAKVAAMAAVRAVVLATMALRAMSVAPAEARPMAVVIVVVRATTLMTTAAVRDKKLNSGVRLRGVMKSTESVKFKLANIYKIKSG